MVSTWPSGDNGYNIANWGEGYVSVDAKGEVCIHPHGDRASSLSLADLADALQQAGLQLPVLVRFPDILQHRVNSLCDTFNLVARQLQYRGGYTAVYPIKVNQQRRVVEEIAMAEPAVSRGQVGLEAGSKPELLAVLAVCPRAATIVCNGYKDREFIRLALIGQRLGHNVHIVIEKPNELPLILEESQRLGIVPHIGVRARLASIGKGNWQNTGGEKSKFGLSSTQILKLVASLEQHQMLECLTLLHFHLGSQIANIRDIQTGLRECAKFYVELRRLGADVKIVDVGGGLGIDYDGTRSRGACSVNYNIHEYALHVLRTLKEECDAANLPHPDIITESGRAMTAHHAVLITNVIDREVVADSPVGSYEEEDLPLSLKSLLDDLQVLQTGVGARSLVEIYHDAAQALQDAQNQFIHGLVNLTQRSMAESAYRELCQLLVSRLSMSNRAHREILDELHEKLADKVFVNFSLFQSMPDIWGIDQIFPILPLSGLNKALTRRAVIQDMTCDSDGRIDQYVDNYGVETTLPLPEPGSEPQLLGFFLLGAYQEILGDLHNLFGDTDSVDVYLSSEGMEFRHIVKGDTVDVVLQYVNFEPGELLAALQRKITLADVEPALQTSFVDELAQGLSGYTYFED